jgi:hypothetical protein
MRITHQIIWAEKIDGWIRDIWLINQPTLFPEGRECFSLSELKAIVEEMEKMEKGNA